MYNEIVAGITVLFSFVFIMFAYLLGRELLYIVIVLNILLISSFGAKLITLFGFTTNAGNIFFASVFIATHFLTEHWGRREGYKTMWIGLISLVFFILMGQLALSARGADQSVEVNQALEVVYKFSARIATASILSYLIVQYLNVTIYDTLHQAAGKKLLWLRVFVATAIGQAVDSVLFFSLAFAGAVPQSILIQSILIGFSVKVGVGLISIPLLYSSYFFAKKKPVITPEQAVTVP